jgi:hypothetical protein
MALHRRYTTWGERIDQAKAEVARAEAIVRLRPAAIERLEMAREVLAKLEAQRRVLGKRRSHVARQVNL